MAIRLSLAAAALILLGFAIGRLSGPAPLDMDELREALAPAVAAAIEPAIREKLMEDMRQRYQVALAATYVKVKEELTEQYRDDLNRFAVQTLAASNAMTNRLLAELIENIDTAQAQDLTRSPGFFTKSSSTACRIRRSSPPVCKRWPAGPKPSCREPGRNSFNCSPITNRRNSARQPQPLQNPNERNEP